MTAREFLLREVPAPEVTGGLFLAIDTAIGTSVAVGHEGRVIEAASADPMAHAEVIGELIHRALSESGVAGTGVTHVIAGMGPGPFTGLRVGIAAATAYARGRGLTPLPLLGHEAVALDAYALPGARPTLTVLQDARRRELFRTHFTGIDADGLPIADGEPTLITRAQEDAEPTDDAHWPELIPAANLVRLATRRLATGRDFASDRARYLRSPDVRQPSAPKRVSS